jgi:putative multiple sugar transport system substrate-binding protein
VKLTKKAVVIAAAISLGLSLAACSGTRGETPPQSASNEATAATGGFEAGSTIGVSLPWLGTQNWKEAETQFATALTEAGYKPIVQAADNKVPQQQSQIEAMIESGAKVLVVAPIDGKQLGTVLEKAKDAGIKIIGYDRLLENTTAVDAVTQYGSIETGRVQGEALLAGLAERKGAGPYNIELFGGGPADPNAPNFFTGAMEVLQPKIDDGTLVVVSGQVEFTQVATAEWDNATAQKRMESLLAGNYQDKKIDGVLTPNDGIARAILTACEDAGQDIPVVDGLDAEDESVVSIWEGKQYATVAKPTPELIAQTMVLIQALQSGAELPPPTSTANNGKIDVPLYELTPVVITKANAKQAFADDPAKLELLK